MPQVNCAACGALVQAGSRCSVCRKPLTAVRIGSAPPASEQPDTGKIIVFAIAALVVLLLITGLVHSYRHSSSATTATAVTNERMLAGPGRTLLAVDERAYDDMMSAAVAKSVLRN